MELHQHNMYTFCQQNAFQCLVHDERHDLVIGFPPFGHRCKDMVMLPLLSTPFHYPRLKIVSKHTALGWGCKQNVGMSKRNYHKHHPAPLFLCNHSTTPSATFRPAKTVVRKKPGKHGSDGLPCLHKAVHAQEEGPQMVRLQCPH